FGVLAVELLNALGDCGRRRRLSLRLTSGLREKTQGYAKQIHQYVFGLFLFRGSFGIRFLPLLPFARKHLVVAVDEVLVLRRNRFVAAGGELAEHQVLDAAASGIKQLGNEDAVA